MMTRSLSAIFALGCALGVATPALAHRHDGNAMPAQGVYQGTWQNGSWSGQWVPGQTGYPAPYPQASGYPQAEPDAHTREMLDRCQSYRRDNGVGGAVIGGVVGGVVGNRIAPHDRTLGTIAGAAVGAVAGAAIDKAEDRGRQRECEDFWRSYSQPQAGYDGYGYPGYPAGYGPVTYMMVPVMMQQAPSQPCVETKTVTYEYVTTPRRRYIPARARPHTKRVKEKRVYIGS